MSALLYTLDTLHSSKAAELKQVAKSFKVPNWWKLKKVELVRDIWKMVPISMKPKPASVEELHKKVSQDTEVFINTGGEVVSLKPQRTPKRKAPTMASAEKNYDGKKPRRICKKLSAPKNSKSRVPRIREDENIVTLQSIIDELGLKGPVARKALRASGIKKPGKQWCWPKDSKELNKVKNLMELTSGLSTSIKKSGSKK